MKSIWKLLALCLCFGLVISMCSCKGNGGGSSSSSSSTTQWTTGSTVAVYEVTGLGNQQRHYFAFQSDGVVGFYDAEIDNITGNPLKTWKWDTTTKKFTPEGGSEITVGTTTSFDYTCSHSKKTYTKK